MGTKLHYSIVLMAISAVCVGGLCGVYFAVKERREKAKRARIVEAVMGACGLTDYCPSPAEVDKYLDTIKPDTVWAAYKSPGKKTPDNLIAYAVKAESKGFGGRITLVVGWSPDTEKVLRVVVVEQHETPGLGDKIQKAPKSVTLWEAVGGKSEKPRQPEILASFRGKTIRELGSEDNPNINAIDAISGATISSKAVLVGVIRSHKILTDALKAKPKK